MDLKMTNAFKQIATGGVVYIPAGVYTFYSTVSVPSRVILRGESEYNTSLVWKKSTLTYGLLYGKGAPFAVENLHLHADMSNMSGVVNTIGIQVANMQNVSWFTNVRLTTRTKRAFSTAFYITNSQNVMIENAYVNDSDNAWTTNTNTNYTRCTNCTFAFRFQSWTVRCGHSAVIENSTRRLLGNATTDGWNGGTQAGFLVGEYCSTSVTRDVYYGNNTSTSEDKNWNDNTLSDGKEGWYYGGIAAVHGTSMVLNGTLRVAMYSSGSVPVTKSTNFLYMLGSLVMIVSGKGRGQFRYLSSAAYNRNVTIDRAWDVLPDATSTIAITKYKARVLVVNNNFSAEGNHGVGWLACSEVHYADNLLSATFKIWQGWQFASLSVNTPIELDYTGGFRYGNGTFPGFQSGSWYHQVLSNTVTGSSGLYIFLTTNTPSSSSHWAKHMNMGNVIRNNANPFSHSFYMTLPAYAGVMLVEKNTFLQKVTYSLTDSYIVFRKNTEKPIYYCGSIKCGNTTNPVVDCEHKCGNTSILLLE
jgi:hypothetical protein